MILSNVFRKLRNTVMSVVAVVSGQMGESKEQVQGIRKPDG